MFCFCPCFQQCFHKNMDTEYVTANRADLIDSFVEALIQKGIKLLAVDFDRTLIDIHSGGFWHESTDRLARHVRPCMRDLLETALNKGLYVGIVTYHRQDWLIKAVLQKVLPKKVANEIYVQANTPEFLQRQWTPELISSINESCASEMMLPYLNGKEAHIAAVVSDIDNDHSVTVNKDEILLFDDDINNVCTARLNGHYALQVRENVDYSSFESYKRQLLL